MDNAHATQQRDQLKRALIKGQEKLIALKKPAEFILAMVGGIGEQQPEVLCRRAQADVVEIDHKDPFAGPVDEVAFVAVAVQQDTFLMVEKVVGFFYKQLDNVSKGFLKIRQ